jgi:hypothetical protein
VNSKHDTVHYVSEFRLFPGFHLGIATSQKALDAEMDRLKAPRELIETDGRCLTIENRATGHLCVLVGFKSENVKTKAVPQVAGLVAHEVLHAFEPLVERFGINIFDHTNVYLFHAVVQEIMEHLYPEKKGRKK